MLDSLVTNYIKNIVDEHLQKAVSTIKDELHTELHAKFEIIPIEELQEDLKVRMGHLKDCLDNTTAHLNGEMDVFREYMQEGRQAVAESVANQFLPKLWAELAKHEIQIENIRNSLYAAFPTMLGKRKDVKKAIPEADKTPPSNLRLGMTPLEFGAYVSQCKDLTPDELRVTLLNAWGKDEKIKMDSDKFTEVARILNLNKRTLYGYIKKVQNNQPVHSTIRFTTRHLEIARDKLSAFNGLQKAIMVQELNKAWRAAGLQTYSHRCFTPNLSSGRDTIRNEIIALIHKNMRKTCKA
jgi:hypothetical protein